MLPLSLINEKPRCMGQWNSLSILKNETAYRYMHLGSDISSVSGHVNSVDKLLTRGKCTSNSVIIFFLNVRGVVSYRFSLRSIINLIKQPVSTGKENERKRKRNKKLLYAFFWVNTRRLEFICRRFGTLCPFHLHRQVDVSRFYSHLPVYEDGTDRVLRNVGI